MDKVPRKETDIRPLNTIDILNQKATQVDTAYHFTVLHFLHLISIQTILDGINGVLTIALLCYKEMNIIMLPPLFPWRGLCSMEYNLSHMVHILEQSICLTPKCCDVGYNTLHIWRVTTRFILQTMTPEHEQNLIIFLEKQIESKTHHK